MNKFIQFFLLSILFFSCSEDKPKSNETKNENGQNTEIQAVPISDTIYSDTYKSATYKKIDPSVHFSPYYFTSGKKIFYLITSIQQKKHPITFDGKFKYGLASEDSTIILPIQFDKIYNPNTVLKGCIEFKLKDKIGVFNFQTLDYIEAQFDYIAPNGIDISILAYGRKNKLWYEIKSSPLTAITNSDFNPEKMLKNYNFKANELGNNFFTYTKYINEESDPTEGDKFVIIPSFLEYLNVFPNQLWSRVISKGESADFGVEDLNVDFQLKKVNSEIITTFLASMHVSELDARGYESERNSLIAYNNITKSINAIEIGESSNASSFCYENSYQFINDSIFETKQSTNSYENSSPYSFSPTFTYYKINTSGEIRMLESNRQYPYTEFIYINDSIFRGCFGIYSDSKDREENIISFNHLSIRDLDIMRNEIFADHGYIFKSKEWSDYFSQFEWYKPTKEKVDDLLTPMEKANIKVILETKNKMKDNEDEFRGKEFGFYVAAG